MTIVLGWCPVHGTHDPGEDNHEGCGEVKLDVLLSRGDAYRLVALVLAQSAATEAPAGSFVPGQVWDDLHAEGLLVTGRDQTGEGDTRTSDLGDAALLEYLGVTPA